MLPHNAIEIVPERVAIVLDYEDRGIRVYENGSTPGWAASWRMTKSITLAEFDKLFPPHSLSDSINDILLYFWYDLSLIS